VSNQSSDIPKGIVIAADHRISSLRRPDRRLLESPIENEDEGVHTIIREQRCDPLVLESPELVPKEDVSR